MPRPKRANRSDGWGQAPATPPWGNNDGWGSGGGGDWGAPAPQPRPCVCALMPKKAPKKNVNDEANSSDSDDGTDEAFDSVVERKDHYLIREQIWCEGLQRWLPYDSSRYEISVPEQDLGNYFYVNTRHDLPGDEGELVLTDFSDTLLKFLRISYGDEFYNDSPERTADSLLPDIPILKAKLDAIEQHLSADAAGSDPADKRAFAVSLGCQEAKQASHPDSHIDQFLKEAQEHITVLNNYLLELYKPKAEKLAMQLSDGCIEFGLLVFYFELNQHYCLDPCNINRATGFRLERRSYDKKKTSLHLFGSAYVWKGCAYTKTSVSRIIGAYTGTEDLRLLSCQPLRPDLEAALVARGRLYTALSGCHYRSFHKDRIIVDRIGYDDPEGQDREPAEEVPDFPHCLLCCGSQSTRRRVMSHG
ncbi:hypothetical protein DFH07DRAFT_848097 [Mycena maculata]|uniref:Uncharacterized protein n=1 Tax=Mycena maculata TaxID=230809 RepID=A0AAD7HZE4_9AGAR|nr:hypothetical protein DFH07DRAFT_848097 [Mycena maculata]